ncbi:MAG: transcriptional regulator [Planctomycetes bacterium]|nr:transcriptional regulator [Planctomycetota bacterium]
MTTHPMKLVTIITEAMARSPVEELLHQVGAHGFTLSSVEGKGATGERAADIREYANIQIQAVVPPAISERLLERLTVDFFPRYAMIAFESDVRVCRPEKF